MTNSKTQTRGNCQCCGSDQAVQRGFMSKHGYTVKHGWFNGVCTGANYKPLQVERSRTDEIIAQVRDDVAALRVAAAQLESGERNPGAYKEWEFVGGKRVEVSRDFVEASEWKQRELRKSAVWNTTQRAKMGDDFANDLQALADRLHGTALTVVALAAPVVPVRVGDQRQGERRVLTATRVDGARVYWKDAEGYKGWTGTQAWRRLALVEQQAAA